MRRPRSPFALAVSILAGFLNRRQRDEIEYVREENRVLRQMLGKRRLQFTDAQRKRLGTASLDRALKEYEAHALHERNHQGVGNEIIQPHPGLGSTTGVVVRRERLGGILSYYHRRAA
jgi:hypothetical protein